MIIDIHTHAFPDSLAEHAVRTLEAETDNVKARLNGTVADLLTSMNRAGVDRSVICSIATKPRQFDPILQWSLAIQSERLIPFASVHPRDPNAITRIRQVRDAGLKGLKLHPYYQDIDLDDPSLHPYYRAIADAGLLLICHTGYDIAFPKIPKASPARIRNLLAAIPDLRLITTHFAGWEDWDAVEALIVGQPIYMDISFSLHLMPPDQIRRMLARHLPTHLLFGSDSPWNDPADTLKQVRDLHLDPGLEQALLGGNAARLLAGG